MTKTRKAKPKARKTAAVTSKKSAPKVLSFAAADKRLHGALSERFMGEYDKVLFFGGDLRVEGDLLSALGATVPGLVVVAGDLAVGGRIALYEDAPSLFVAGATSADTLEGGDAEIHLEGGASFTYLVHGYYNHGTLHAGKVVTPYVINSDHDLSLSCEEAYWIDNHGDDASYDFGVTSIRDNFVPAVLNDAQRAIDVPAFLAYLRAGKAVLQPGAKTASEAARAEVKAAKADRPQELDLRKKKLSKFPAEVLEMTWLKRLLLDDNDITSIPEAIGVLTELEELSLSRCNLTSLPASIGKLTKLRVLRLAANPRAAAIRGAEAIALPESIGELEALEEIDLSDLTRPSGHPADQKAANPTYTLPQAAGSWKRLRTIVADNTNLVLPAALEGSTSIEHVSMCGGSASFLRHLPTWLTTLPRLKTLRLSGNFFHELPAALGDLEALETLDLDNAVALVRELPDLSRLSNLRVLRLSGGSKHSDVERPQHAILEQLLGMKLPMLEELTISRWGEVKGHRSALTPPQLSPIGAFAALKTVDLEFNDLAALPESFFGLTALSHLKACYNDLDAPTLHRLRSALPEARIDD